MKRFVSNVLCLTAMCLIGSTLSWGAEPDSSNDDQFISLTRRAMPASTLPTNTSVITSQEIKDSGAKSLDQVLDHATAVQVQRTGSLGSFADVKMRGVPGSSQVQIFIDDQPFGGFAANQLVDLSLIPVDNIDHIEFVRGGSSILYGANTTGGVIHIFTKQYRKDVPGIAVGVERQSFDTNIVRGQVGAKTAHADLFATVSHANTDGFQHNSDANNIASSLNTGFSFGNGSRLAVQAATLSQDGGVPQGTAVPTSDWDGEKERVPTNPTKRALNKRTEGRVRFDAPVGDNQSVQALAFGSRSSYFSHMSIDTLFDPDFSTRSSVVGSDLRYLGPMGFTVGASAEKDTYHNPTSNIDKDLTAWGLYWEQIINQGKWNIIPAIRFDHNGNFGSQYNPRISFVCQIDSFWAVSANAARSFRAPSFFDLFYDNPPTYISNRNLKPESAWTYDFGNRFTFNKDNEIKLTGFYTKIKDRIVGVDVDGDFIIDTNANLSKSETEGAEFEFKNRIGFVSQTGNYTYSRSRGTTVSSTKYVDFAVTPHHMINYDIAMALPMQFRLSNNVRYVSKQYEAADNRGRKLPCYAVWNGRLSKTLTKSQLQSELYFGVNNILDRHYGETFDFAPITFAGTIDPQPTRTYIGGVEIQFGGQEPAAN